MSVTVTLTCPGATVVEGAQSVSEASPGVWTVLGFSGITNCTATEYPIPSPYGSLGCSAPIIPYFECTIVNFLPQSQSPTPTGPVGGFVDVVTAGGTDGGGNGSTFVLLGLLLAVAVTGVAVVGFRRASSR
jgi:hypothetical protein